jgi:hypothetical protein
VTIMMEILCSADYCEYGSSPRGAWAIPDKYEQNLATLLDWYFGKWGQVAEIDSNGATNG